MKILKFIKFTFFSIIVYALFSMSYVGAQEPVGNVPQSQNPINGWGFNVAPANVPTDLVATLLNITNFILGFAAMIATLVIIYGGVVYLTSLGNDDRAAQAKKIIASGIIGLIIIGLAYAIVTIVINILMT
jgi:hypothetical protein